MTPAVHSSSSPFVVSDLLRRRHQRPGDLVVPPVSDLNPIQAQITPPGKSTSPSGTPGRAGTARLVSSQEGA